MSESKTVKVEKTPWHLWLTGIVGFLWSSMGILDYVMTQTKNESYMEAFTPEQLLFFYTLPAWVTATWAIAVWACVVGSILLLLRKKVAVWIYLVSFITMLITAFQNYILSYGMEVIGDTFTLIFTAFILFIALGLYWYSRAMLRLGILV